MFSVRASVPEELYIIPGGEEVTGGSVFLLCQAYETLAGDCQFWTFRDSSFLNGLSKENCCKSRLLRYR